MNKLLLKLIFVVIVGTGAISYGKGHVALERGNDDAATWLIFEAVVLFCTAYALYFQALDRALKEPSILPPLVKFADLKHGAHYRTSSMHRIIGRDLAIVTSEDNAEVLTLDLRNVEKELWPLEPSQGIWRFEKWQSPFGEETYKVVSVASS